MNSLIQSYVKRRFFISTILRQSSAIEGPREYYETIVWEWNPETRDRGELLEQYDSGLSECMAMENHFRICLELSDRE